METGRASLMIAQDVATVAELNLRARRDRQTAGHVGCVGVALADGLEAAIGDVVVTRCNDRSLRLPDGGWVRNRDRWCVMAVGKDGSMTVRQAGGADNVVLPTEYVAEHVELAYASTTYSAQGMTADTAHALVTTAMTGEVLYVAATRGRDSNRLYVDVCPVPAQPKWRTVRWMPFPLATCCWPSPPAAGPSCRPTRPCESRGPRPQASSASSRSTGRWSRRPSSNVGSQSSNAAASMPRSWQELATRSSGVGF